MRYTVSKKNDILLEYKDYEIEGMTEDDKKWIVDFYREHYFGDFYNKNKSNSTDDNEVIKEANRTNNRRQTDVYSISDKHNILDHSKSFMEDYSDAYEWRDAYTIGGFELASKFIMNHTLRDLDNANISKETTLVRFYYKLNKLRKLELQQRRQKNG